MRGRWLRRVAVCGLLVSLVVLVAGPAAAWWDGKWKYRKKIVLDTTPQGGDVKEALTDFPVLVRLHTGNFTFENAKSDGADIRFVASDDKTPLKYHIERYDPKEEMVLIWVKVPRIAPASNEGSIWIYYGNSAAAAGEDAGGTYDTPQLVVYHLGEKEGLPQDATSYKNNAKEFTGKLGTPSRHRPGHHPERRGRPPRDRQVPFPQLREGLHLLRLGPPRPRPDRRPPLLLGRREAVDGDRRRRDEALLPPSRIRRKARPTRSTCPSSKWVHVAVTAEPGKDARHLYGRTGRGPTQKLTGPSRARCRHRHWRLSPGKNGFAGDLDEVGIAGVARPPAWVHAAAVGQGPETPLLSYQEEESTSGRGGEPDRPPPRRHRQGHHPGRVAHHRRHRRHDRHHVDPLLQQVRAPCAS